MKSIKVVSFGTSTIQKGDTVKIDLDVASATILIRKDAGSNKPEVGAETARA